MHSMDIASREDACHNAWPIPDIMLYYSVFATGQQNRQLSFKNSVVEKVEQILDKETYELTEIRLWKENTGYCGTTLLDMFLLTLCDQRSYSRETQACWDPEVGLRVEIRVHPTLQEEGE